MAYNIPECPKRIPNGGNGSIENDREFSTGEFRLKGDLIEINS